VPHQPCVETASAAALQHGSAFASLRTRGLAWSALPAPPPPKQKAPTDRLRRREMVYRRLVEGQTGLPQLIFPVMLLNTIRIPHLRREDTRVSQLYVLVILRNAREYVLARHGHLAPAQVHTYETPQALIDTGALHVVLPPHVAEQLGLLLLG